MRNKLIIISVLLLLISGFFVFAQTLDDYRPSWLESWNANQTGVLYNFWHSLNPFTLPKGELDPYDNADVYGWYNNTFFGLANWEREVCLIDLATDVRNIRNTATPAGLDEPTIYTTTISVSATKEYFFNNTYLYEVSWYIMPYSNDVLYRVYLKKDDDKEYFVGKKGDKDTDWKTISRLSGDAGYDARYIQKVFDKVVLEYKDYGSDIVNEMVLSVVNKTVG